ncbi:MAG: glycoside hydrolase family 3 C-terminal domain-containing protein [Bacteroidetes bacterium]|nr:glycoside hydrolase family 3 C-terminal domain-containing protein [Bacteroidota bacterium]MBS1755777.1 glycoside hydrolase family 3 C-terminal domain-containing protein [Bacteroidota bacterium]
MKYFIGLLVISIFYCGASAQSINTINPAIEKKIENTLKQMTLDEKIDYIGGINRFYIRGIKRLGIPEIRMSDGPTGIVDYGQSTSYPAGILAASTWDTLLVYQLGRALGRDARARGVNILLAPGVNIYRAPMCGRNFEYFGEDPYLSSRLAVNYIKGVQSQRVAATVKHFAGNNQEWNRYQVSSDIDERTLQEIYFPAFKAAVQQANVACVMNSYNLLNGIHTSQNKALNIDVLKKGWGFRGILMSDWVSVHESIAAVNNGLDLEMPSALYMNREAIIPAIKKGIVTEETINDKVRRILRVIFTYNFQNDSKQENTIVKEDTANRNTALNIARAGMVLLKNEQNILPLQNIKTLAVIGPNGGGYISGGGSSDVPVYHYTSLVKGLQNITGPGVKITYTPVINTILDDAEHSVFYTEGLPGLKATYFNNDSLSGTPGYTRIEKTINHHWAEAPDVPGLGKDHFSIRWTGNIVAPASDTFTFSIRGDDGYRLWINDSIILNEWQDQGAITRKLALYLEAGKTYSIKLEYYENAGTAEMVFSWGKSTPDYSAAIAAAKNADAVIIAAGFDHETEGEGRDRTFELPGNQALMIDTIARQNPRSIVVLNAGGNVNMQGWLPKIKALLYAWYPGQEGGTAIAEILFGKINPSGKLPASFEKKWEDNPVYNNYYDNNNDKHVAYKEGLFYGYRYFDTSTIKPQFAFGFGLSYTKFTYSNLIIKKLKGPSAKVLVSFTIKNTGSRDGSEVAQVYVHQDSCTSIRPVKELKGFTKVFLKKGEARVLTVSLNEDAFSYYKTGEKKFGYDKGRFNIEVGAASNDIRLQKKVVID